MKNEADRAVLSFEVYETIGEVSSFNETDDLKLNSWAFTRFRYHQSFSQLVRVVGKKKFVILNGTETESTKPMIRWD